MRLATGVSGLNSVSPAMSVAQKNGRMIFSVFEKRNYSVYSLEPELAAGAWPATNGEFLEQAGVLPPVSALNESRDRSFWHAAFGRDELLLQ